MPVDPQIQALLDLRAKLPPLHTLSVADARAQMAIREIPGVRIPSVASVVNRDMQGPAGSLPLRIYTPRGDGPLKSSTRRIPAAAAASRNPRSDGVRSS